MLVTVGQKEVMEIVSTNDRWDPAMQFGPLGPRPDKDPPPSAAKELWRLRVPSEARSSRFQSPQDLQKSPRDTAREREPGPRQGQGLAEPLPQQSFSWVQAQG